MCCHAGFRFFRPQWSNRRVFCASTQQIPQGPRKVVVVSIERHKGGATTSQYLMILSSVEPERRAWRVSSLVWTSKPSDAAASCHLSPSRYSTSSSGSSACSWVLFPLFFWSVACCHRIIYTAQSYCRAGFSKGKEQWWLHCNNLRCRLRSDAFFHLWNLQTQGKCNVPEIYFKKPQTWVTLKICHTYM